MPRALGVHIYPKVKGRDFENFMALIDGVQDTVAIAAADIAVDAEALLADHHVEDVAHIEVVRSTRYDHPDRWVCLVDSNVTNEESATNNSALSIEMGRAGYIDENGETYGEMEGLYILSQAAGVKRRRHRIAKIRRNRPKRGPHGRFIT